MGPQGGSFFVLGVAFLFSLSGLAQGAQTKTELLMELSFSGKAAITPRAQPTTCNATSWEVACASVHVTEKVCLA